jgi:heat shock protein HtpX
MSETKRRWQARIGNLKAWALLVGLFVVLGIWILALDAGERPGQAGGLVLAIAGLGVLLLLCVATLFFPSTVFFPQPVEATAAPAAGEFVTKATGRFRKLAKLEPAIEVGKGARRFREVVARLVPLEGQQVMVYVHLVESQGVYGIPLFQQRSNWAIWIDPANTLSVEPGKLLGWRDRCAAQVQYSGDKGKLQTLILTFDDAGAQLAVLSALQQMGFAVGTGSPAPPRPAPQARPEDCVEKGRQEVPVALRAGRPDTVAPPLSLRRRAIVAVLLTFGFYGLALAICAFLLFIAYAQVVFLEHVDGRFVLLCIVAAGVILWSILPRIDRFTPPGPRLRSEENPDLFRQVNDIANRVGQKPPNEVYLLADLNAFVAERGGWLGIGRRRVMGIGLPLLQTLAVAQLQGVIAHEFGHFYGGDTKLAPWIYQTRQAIARTLQNLGGRSWLYVLFRWYGMMFLRVTHGISRRQELVADRLAAQLVGSRPFIEGLQTIHGVAPAFQSFLVHEVAPAVRAGYRPSLTEGFDLFLRHTMVAEAIRRAAEEGVAGSETNPYDTHPSLKERIEAVQSLSPDVGGADDTGALSLVPDVLELELELFAGLVGTEQAASLSPVEWQSTATKIWLPYWERSVRDYAAGLKGITAADLPGVLQSPGELGAMIQRSAGRLLSVDEQRTGAMRVAATALAVVLARQGWALDTSPGAPVSLQKGEIRIEPYTTASLLETGELTADAWQAQCRQAGIAGLRLDLACSAE